MSTVDLSKTPEFAIEESRPSLGHASGSPAPVTALTVFTCLTCGTTEPKQLVLAWHEMQGHQTAIMRLKLRTRGKRSGNIETQWSTDWARS